MKRMEIKQYDDVLLKDGREAAIVEKFSDADFLADVGNSPKDWETISVTASDIERVLSHGQRMDESETVQTKIERLNALFAEKYESFTLNGRRFFILEREGAVAFAVDSFSDCFVLEYAETMRDVMVNRLEDGDCFSVDMSVEETYQAMIREIES